MRLLVNAPSGQQEIIEIGAGGSYFEESRVLWDERVDGPLPEITLGGMARVGNELIFDQARMDEAAAASMPKKEEIQLQIDALERSSLENRGARELHLLEMEDIASKQAELLSTPEVPVTPEMILAQNVYYTKLKALDTQIRALRDQYNAIVA